MLRAVALACFLLASAAAHAGEGCNALDGTYRNESEPVKTRKEHLDDFVRMRDGGRDPRLMQFGKPVGNRVVNKHFASTATFRFDGKILHLEFHDADGKAIVSYPADYPYEWKCIGTRFEWEYEGLSGIGDAIVETRTHVTLSRLESGDLQMVEVRTDSRKKGESHRTEILFRGARN